MRNPWDRTRIPGSRDVDTVRIGDVDMAFSTAMGHNIAPGSTAGLPVAIELDGPAGADRAVLAIGLAIEALLGPLRPGVTV